MRRPICLSLLCCSLLSLSTLASLPTRADDTPRPIPLPAWQTLEFEQQAYFVTARSQLAIAPDSADPTRWQLTANSSVASNSEDVVLELAPADGRALRRSRLSKGKEQRYKTYDFLPDYILRVRHDPPADTAVPPAQWPVSSRKKITYPALEPGVVVTDAYALVLLAERFGRSTEASAEVAVNTEFNFYRVRMSHTDGPPLKVDYQLAGAGAISGSRQTRGVALQVSPLGEQREKPDFSLLGLNGDITVLFDADSGLPLQLRGTAPRIGSTEINLKAAKLRNPAE